MKIRKNEEKPLPIQRKMVYNSVYSQSIPGAEGRQESAAKGKDVIMRLKRSILTTMVIVFAFVIYAGIHLVSLHASREAVLQEQHEIRREAAELQLQIAQLEHDIEHYDDPDVKANIARSNLGLVLPGEIVFFDAGSGQSEED